jgi:hypothetical protein
MKTRYHIQITQKALFQHFSEQALQVIIKANINQDRIKYQFGHDHFHFDGSAFKAGFAYIKDQEDLIIKNIKQEEFGEARKALGRLTHTWQDFYSHSNYVQLWIEKNKDLPPERITPADTADLHRSDLRSGKNYGIIEFLAMVPGISNLIQPHMPADSHAKMNLDSPASGILFQFAYWAAYKQTIAVYDRLMLLFDNNGIDQDKISLFKDQ